MGRRKRKEDLGVYVERIKQDQESKTKEDVAKIYDRLYRLKDRMNYVGSIYSSKKKDRLAEDCFNFLDYEAEDRLDAIEFFKRGLDTYRTLLEASEEIIDLFERSHILVESLSEYDNEVFESVEYEEVELDVDVDDILKSDLQQNGRFNDEDEEDDDLVFEEFEIDLKED